MNLYRCFGQRSFEDSLEYVWLVPPSDRLPRVPSSWFSRYNDLDYPYTVSPVGASPGGMILVDTTAGPGFVAEGELQETPLVAPQYDLFNLFRFPTGVEMDSGSNIPEALTDPGVGTRNQTDPLLRVSDLVLYREMPAITGAPNQTEAHTQSGGCSVNEWVSQNPFLALAGLGVLYFALKGGK